MKPRELSSWTHLVLKEAIISGVLAPGDRVVEEQIALQLGVSRAPVREAMLRLCSAGLLTQGPNGRTIVREYSVAKIHEILYVRELLEVAAIRLACDAPKARRHEQLPVLEAILDKEAGLLLKPNPSRQHETNLSFHKTIWELAGNVHLKQTLLHNLDHIHVALSSSPHTKSTLERSHSQHRDLVAAIESSEGEEAVRLMMLHISATRENIQRAFEKKCTRSNLRTLAATLKEA